MEEHRVGIFGCGGEPALEKRTERDATDVFFEGGGEAQADGAEARHEPGIAEGGGRQRGGGGGRWTGPHPVFEIVDGRRTQRHERGASGTPAVGGDEAEIEAFGGGGGEARFEDERGGLEDEGLAFGEHDGLAGGARAENIRRGLGGEGLAQGGWLEAGAGFGGEGEGEGGLGSREVLEVDGTGGGEGHEPFLRRRAPRLAGAGAHLDEQTALGAHAGAQASELDGGGMGAGGGAGVVGGGECALPRGEIVLEEVFRDGRAGGGGVGEGTENFRDGVAGEFVVVGDVLPECPGIGGGGRVIPPAGVGRCVERGAAGRRMFKAMTQQGTRIERAVGLGKFGEERGEVFQLGALGGGEGPAEFRGEHGRPLLAERFLFGRRCECGRRDGRDRGQRNRGFGVGIGCGGVVGGGGEPSESGGVDVFAVGRAFAGTTGGPLPARKEEGDEEFFFIGDVGFNVVVGIAAQSRDLAGFVAARAPFADRLFKRAQPRAECGERLGRLGTADDLMARFGGHDGSERGRRGPKTARNETNRRTRARARSTD